LNRIVDFHNSKTRDLDVSIHFNAYENTTTKKMGVECLWVSQEDLAAKVSKAMADASNLPNRGAKYRSDLFFLNNTSQKSILVETLFCDAKPDCDAYRARFDLICAALASAISGQVIQPGPTPPPGIERPPVRPPTEPDEGEHPTIKKGDNNAAVAELQKALGVLIADGDFGGITETWVKAFQAACGLKADGIVGDITWDEVDELNARVAMGGPRLPPGLTDQIVKLAEGSDIQEYLWPDRGMTPPGFIPGMALCFAYVMQQFEEGDDAATVMCKAQGSPDKDALAWYAAEFKKLGMSNARAGVETLRHLFVMMIGLGPRESSARYVEGRDLSAGSSSTQSDTCEAGLFQTSWNIKGGSSAIAPLLPDFWDNPNGFREQFKLDVNPTADNLNSYGSGDGVRYQWLSRFCPLFHVMVTGVGMRTLRQHWGPINRREVTLKKEADQLLKDVQALVEGVA
jgi:peptidoglycan hydrolase-like protein with peptidoglycan-binding domain